MRQIQIFFFLIATVLSYGQVTLVSDVSGREFKVNQKFTLTFILEISDGKLVQQTSLRLPDFSKFNRIADGSERNTLYIDRTSIRQVIYQFVLSPKVAGEMKIGSGTVTVNGQIYKTEPIDITVLEAEKTAVEEPVKAEAGLYLNLEVKDREVYLNQPTIAVLKAYSKNFDNFRKVKNVIVPQQNNAEYSNINNEKFSIESTKNNISSQVLAIFLVYPNKDGSINMKPFSAKYGKKSAKLLSNTVKLKVKSLPKNPPLNFKNAVGNFKLELTAVDAEKLEIEKPFHVFLKISGIGNLGNIQLPKVKNSELYEIFPPKITKDFAATKKGLDGSILVDYVIRPKTTGPVIISTEDFSYFDVESEKYVPVGAKTVAVAIYSKDEILGFRTPLQRVNEYTNNVLQTVDNPVLQTKKLQVKETGTIDWKTSFLNLLLFCGVLGILILINFWKNKKKSVNQTLIKDRQHINEVPIQNSSIGNLEDSFGYLKRMLREKNFSEFFATVSKMDSEIKDAYVAQSGSDFLAVLEKKKGPQIAENYRSLSQMITIERYAPVANEEQISELLPTIINLYSVIAK